MDNKQIKPVKNVNSNTSEQNLDLMYSVPCKPLERKGSKYSKFKLSLKEPVNINETQFNKSDDVLEYDIPLSQNLPDIKQSPKNSKDMSWDFNACFTFDDLKKCDGVAKDVGTMTEHLSAKQADLEIQCNELFGKIVAYEISNFTGKERYDKMKEIIEIFKNIKT